jgi:hypothetical protein
MNLTKRNVFFFLFFLFSKIIFAQSLATPSDLSVSYKKYTNRIELTWQATAIDHHYIILRKERSKTSFSPLDTVRQNRYVDRKNLHNNTEYVYQVQSVEPSGTTSAPSKNGVGALLVVADGNLAVKDSFQLKNCLNLTITEAKLSRNYLALRFLSASTCNNLTATQLSMYHSKDAILDDGDVLLTQKPFDLTRKRGALTAKNTLEKSNLAFLILQINSENGSFYVAKKIE